MYNTILEELAPSGTQLVAVSKTKPTSAIQDLYDQGQRHFGENRVQECVDKYNELPKDINWHIIGNLQKNKVKYIAPFVHLIHSVDSYSLLATINKEAKKNNRTIPVLLQFKIASEDTKAGMTMDTLETLTSSIESEQLDHVSIQGVMGMASFTSDMDQVRGEFQQLKAIFDQVKTSYFSQDDAFQHISMGMSGDYKVAVAEGSTMVRIGSLLFGTR